MALAHSAELVGIDEADMVGRTRRVHPSPSFSALPLMAEPASGCAAG